MTANTTEDSVEILYLQDVKGDLEDVKREVLRYAISRVGALYFLKGDELEFKIAHDDMPDTLLRLNLSVEVRDYDS